MSSAGSYLLDGDIGPSSSGPICLNISASDVTVDCVNHVVNGALSIISGATNVAVRNCTLGGTAKSIGVSNVTISNSIISGIVFVVNSHNVVLEHNQIAVLGGPVGGVVYLQGGGNNTVVANVLDGGYHGNDLSGQGRDQAGADDGVVLNNEVGDTIRDNTIRNVFDAGIEGVDTVSGTTISNNSITHAMSAGIASYWCTAWDSTTISGNSVSDSQAAIRITYSTGSLCDQIPAPPGRFTQNTLTGNSLRSPLGTSGLGILVSLANIARSVGPNLIASNDVGMAAIQLLPISGFSNTGGNTCGAGGNVSC